MRAIESVFLAGVGCLVAFPGGTNAAEDKSVSSVAGCEVSAGSAVESANGMKASGGTAVLKCPLSKRIGTSSANTVYARINRAQAEGADPFCYLISMPPYGNTTAISYGYATSNVGAQSINIPMPSLYLTGYIDLYCLLNNNDIFYGFRHVQVD